MGCTMLGTRQRAARFYSSCHWWCCVIEQFFVLFFVLFSLRSYFISASAEHRADCCFWRCFGGANNMFSNFSKDCNFLGKALRAFTPAVIVFSASLNFELLFCRRFYFKIDIKFFVLHFFQEFIFSSKHWLLFQAQKAQIV